MYIIRHTQEKSIYLFINAIIPDTFQLLYAEHADADVLLYIKYADESTIGTQSDK